MCFCESKIDVLIKIVWRVSNESSQIKRFRWKMGHRTGASQITRPLSQALADNAIMLVVGRSDGFIYIESLNNLINLPFSGIDVLVHIAGLEGLYIGKNRRFAQIDARGVRVKAREELMHQAEKRPVAEVSTERQRQ
jgi:hypothetical protein